MRVLFATAPWSSRELYPPRMTNGKMSITGASPPLGILYLSAVLKRVGHQTALADGNGKDVDYTLEQIRQFEPAMVGIASSSFAWKRSAELARRIKQEFPHIRTLVGGPHVTGVMIGCLEDGIDFGLAGEAEESLPLLVAALESGAPLESVPGLAYRTPDGSPRFTPVRYPKDLDSLPLPDYDLVDIRNYPPSIAFYNRLPSMTMMTTRGCPALCNFCDAVSNFRLRSLDSVVQDIKYLKQRFGVRHILFYDEDLALARRRLNDMCDRFVAERLDITWCCNARADSLDEPTVKNMKRAGCWRILVGIETGNPELLKQTLKNTTHEEIKRQVRMVRRYGIEVMGTFIFGMPGETYAMGQQTIDFAIECDLDYAIFLKLTPFPGTAIARGIESKGRLTGNYAPNLISFVPNSMTEEELATLSAEAVRRFYMRPSYLIRRGLRMRSLTDLERNLRGFFSFLGLKGNEYMTGSDASPQAEPEALHPALPQAHHHAVPEASVR